MLRKTSERRSGAWYFLYGLFSSSLRYLRDRLEEEIARMKKNQERRLHRKNAKIVKEGGVPMQLNRPMKPDTTVRIPGRRRCSRSPKFFPLSRDDAVTAVRWGT